LERQADALAPDHAPVVDHAVADDEVAVLRALRLRPHSSGPSPIRLSQACTRLRMISRTSTKLPIATPPERRSVAAPGRGGGLMDALPTSEPESTTNTIPNAESSLDR